MLMIVDEGFWFNSLPVRVSMKFIVLDLSWSFGVLERSLFMTFIWWTITALCLLATCFRVWLSESEHPTSEEGMRTIACNLVTFLVWWVCVNE